MGRAWSRGPGAAGVPFALFGAVLVAFMAFFMEASIEYVWFVELLDEHPGFFELVWTPERLQEYAEAGIKSQEQPEGSTWSFYWLAGIGFVIGGLATLGGIIDPGEM